MHPSRRGRRRGGGGVVVDGSTCSRFWERRTTCWVTMRVPDPNILVVRRLLPVHVGRDLDPHVTACSKCEGARACGGGGVCWACFWSGPISVGGGRGSKRSAPLFPGPQGEPAHGLHPRFVVAVIWADRGLGGGGGACAVPPGCAAGGGPVGRGVALPHSVPLPSLGRQQSGCHWRCAVHGGRGPPYHSGSCSPGFSGYDLCGVLVRRRGLACSSRPPWEPAAGAGGRVALLLLSRAGGGPSPLPRGVGAGAPAACGPVGGRGGGVSRRGLPAPLLGGGLRYSIPAPFVSPARSLAACACGRGRSAALGWGGVRGGPWTAPPGALADLNPPSALPEWAVVTGGSRGARPSYCSVVRVAPAPAPGASHRLGGRALPPPPST